MLYKELGVARFMMVPLGLWNVTKDSSPLLKYFKYLVITLVLFNMLFVLVPMILYIFYEDVSASIRIKAMMPAIYYINSSIKYFVLVSRIEDIGICLERITEDWQRAHNLQVLLQKYF